MALPARATVATTGVEVTGGRRGRRHRGLSGAQLRSLRSRYTRILNLGLAVNPEPADGRKALQRREPNYKQSAVHIERL